MDSTLRLIGKATTWQISGLVTMTAIGYMFTGSLSAGGGIALTGAIAGFAAYFVHELIWSRVHWGRNATSKAE